MTVFGGGGEAVGTFEFLKNVVKVHYLAVNNGLEAMLLSGSYNKQKESLRAIL